MALRHSAHTRLPKCLVRSLNDDLDVVAEQRQEPNEAVHRESPQAPGTDRRDLWLVDPETLSGFHLGETALPDHIVDLKGKLGLEQGFLWVRYPDVCEDIVAANRDRNILAVLAIDHLLLPFGSRPSR